jgi:outer membrane protein TolC
MGAFSMSGTIFRWHLRWFVGLVGLPLSLAAWAVDVPVVTSGLAGALEQAWRLHPQAAALEAREAEVGAAQDIANGLTPEPGSVSLGSRNDRYNRNQGKQEWEVELAAPLWLPGQRAARMDESASRVSETVAKRAALRLELAGEVREAWWSLAAARNARALAIRRVETARALEADVQRRYKVGDLSKIDFNLAQTEALAAEAERIEAEATLLQAEQIFRTLTGVLPPQDMAEEAVRREAKADFPASQKVSRY